jgi:lipopolysaccharide heptosyltransferase II
MRARDTLISAVTALHSGAAYWVGRLLVRPFDPPRVRASTISSSEVRSILVVRPDEIGDVVMTSALLRELRRRFPDAHITLVVNPATHNLVERCPYVDETLVFDVRVPRRWRPLVLPWRALQLARGKLRNRRFDVAVLPRWETDSVYATFLAYFSGAPHRVGHSEQVHPRKQRLNRGYDRLLSMPLRSAEPKHQVEHNLDLVRALGGDVEDDRLEVWPGADDEHFATTLLEEHGVSPDTRLIAFGPSGGHSALKQWPVERFAELGRRLHEEHGARILVIGGPGEEQLGRSLRQALGYVVIDTVGRTSLRQMAALLQRCDLYVGNDAGPLHIATAAAIPVVAVFGSSDHRRFGPWGRQHRTVALDLPCSPVHQDGHPDRCTRCIFDAPHCLLGVEVNRMMNACVEALCAEGGPVRGKRFRSAEGTGGLAGGCGEGAVWNGGEIVPTGGPVR